MPKVAVLGAGPAGLLAAHAADGLGFEVDIYSLGEPSELHGAQFLPKSIPGINAPMAHVDISLHGTIEQYSEKAYDPEFRAPVDPAALLGLKVAIDIRSVYRQLWEKFAVRNHIYRFHRTTFGTDAADLLGRYSVVFNSIPADRLCRVDEHVFKSQKIYAVGDAPELGIHSPVRMQPNRIFYNGTEDASWCRASNIFGRCTVEWPATEGRRKPPISNVVRVLKPMSTNCDCHPGIVRIGRYGEWRKGVFATDAYDKAGQYLRNEGMQGVLF